MKFDYKLFKKEMMSRGHEVKKKGVYIIIIPNNNYLGCGKGFHSAWNLIDEKYWECLKFVKMDHFNTTIYSAKFRVLEITNF